MVKYPGGMHLQVIKMEYEFKPAEIIIKKTYENNTIEVKISQGLDNQFLDFSIFINNRQINDGYFNIKNQKTNIMHTFKENINFY